MIKKFRKKPVVVEAIQWLGDNKEEIDNFVNLKLEYKDLVGNEVNQLLISTLEGTMTAMINDWIIKGVKGEFYPCKPDIFAESYEEVK